MPLLPSDLDENLRGIVRQLVSVARKEAEPTNEAPVVEDGERTLDGLMGFSRRARRDSVSAMTVSEVEAYLDLEDDEDDEGLADLF